MAAVRSMLVLGATSGIGRALALAGAARAWRVTAVGRRRALLDSLVREAPGIRPLELDLTDENAADRVDALLRETGAELIVFCAGCGEIDPEMRWEITRRTLELNVLAFTRITDCCYRCLAAGSGGQYAAIASIAGLCGIENDSGYSASKAYMIHYLAGLRRKAEREYHPVAVTTILPGFVDTAMAKGAGRFRKCSPAVAAACILDGLDRGREVIYVTPRWRLAAWVLRWLPERWFRKI